jgi:hypothetical protein
MNIVENAIKEVCLNLNNIDKENNLNIVDKEKFELEQKINKESFNSTDVHTTLDDGKQYFELKIKYNLLKEITFYILTSDYYTKDKFYPVNYQGNKINWIRCNFDNNEVLKIKTNRYGKEDPQLLTNDAYWEDVYVSKLTVLIYQDDKKNHVNLDSVYSLRVKNLELKTSIEKNIKELEVRLNTFESEINMPFVPENIKNNIKNIVPKSINSQIEALEIHKKGCNRIMDLISQIIRADLINKEINAQ